MRSPVAASAPVVLKVGSSSLLDEDGALSDEAVSRTAGQVGDLWEAGHPCALVSSGAVAAGLPVLGLTERPPDIAGLQAAAAVGQGRLMERYARAFEQLGRPVGQVLLTREVLSRRTQYLNAREALSRMLGMGVVPIVNENDTVAVDELRFGDNDTLAAITSHLLKAGMLLLLTDTTGLFSEDPNGEGEARLIDAVRHTDETLQAMRSIPGTGQYGSGGVATKVLAAQMASWSGIPTVVAAARDRDIASRAVAGDPVGTWIEPRDNPLPSRKLWLAFGVAPAGRLHIDEGASRALSQSGASLLAVGVREVESDFTEGDAVEIVHDGAVLAKGITSLSSAAVRAARGRHSSQVGGVVVHRDDLVVLT